MPSRGTDYDRLNESLVFTDDGLACRRGGAWTRHKAALLAYYLPAFAALCTEKAGGWYFLDGFAGNGANSIQGFPLSKGTALIGVGTQPFPKLSILIEKERADVDVLAQRCSPMRDRVQVYEGDANILIPARISEFSNRRLPGFCVLDPEGLELDWETVAACAQRRRGSYPYELLIYFSTPGAARSAGVQDATLIRANESRLSRLFGNDEWRQVADLQRAGAFAPNEAGSHYLALYRDQLLGLGYKAVLTRPAVREDGRLVYHLVFASANAAGEQIMRQAMERAYSGQLPFQV